MSAPGHGGSGRTTRRSVRRPSPRKSQARPSRTITVHRSASSPGDVPVRSSSALIVRPGTWIVIVAPRMIGRLNTFVPRSGSR